VTGECRKLHNEELNELYSLPNIVRVVKSRRVRRAVHVARTGEERVVHRVLVGKPEEKRPLGRPRRRWEDNIKMGETRILIRLLRMYFARNWEFGSALSKLRNFGGQLNPPPPKPPSRYATEFVCYLIWE
jgi:hypothetical protein